MDVYLDFFFLYTQASASLKFCVHLCSFLSFLFLFFQISLIFSVILFHVFIGFKV